MIVIGEKINGAIPSVEKAIKERNADFIRDLAVRQVAGGAEYIDVCSSVVEGDVEVLKWLINLVQEVTDAKICIDSPSAQSCVDAIPFCNKPGLINSVSMEGNKIDIVFPAIANTKWECVALLCGDNGIPDTAEERLEIFGQIMDKAKQYGIAPSRLHIDPLVISLGTNPESFTIFEAVTRQVKAQYPNIHVTSGLSNISFGLPSRKTINQAFLIMAMAAGMDSAIMDPTDRNMLGAMYATEALLDIDEYCIEYLNAYRADMFGVQKAK